MELCSPWATLEDLQGSCGVPEDLTEDDLDLCLQMASDMLFHLSGSRWPGTCAGVDWRPPADAYCRPHGIPPRIDLWKATGGMPVLSGPTSVTIDGEVVASSTYRLDNARWLTRLADELGANPGWPHRQRLDLATTEAGTFVISGFTFGARPPAGGTQTAAVLACEFAKARSAEKEANEACQLPKRLQTVSREGVTIGVALDPQTFLSEGRTGVYFVDLWLSTVNGAKLRRRPTIVNPDDIHEGLISNSLE